MSNEEQSTPATVMCYSEALAAFVEGALEVPVEQASPEEVYAALQRVYAFEGEKAFDPFNSADMLARACMLVDVKEGTL